MSFYMGQVQIALKQHGLALQEMGASGALEPAKIESRSDIEKARKATEKFKAANEAIIATQTNIEQILMDALKARGVSDENADEFMNGLRSRLDTPKEKKKRALVVEIRQTDLEITAQAEKMLSLLERRWGRWSVDGEGQLTFQGDKATREFNGYAEAMGKAGERQQKLQAELLKM